MLDWQSNPICNDLFESEEYKRRDTLQNNECVILAHLIPNKYIPVASRVPIETTISDSKKILKISFLHNYKKKSDIWSKGFVSRERIITGHIIFWAGTYVPICMLHFDKTLISGTKIYENSSFMTYPLFDRFGAKKIEENIHNAATLATASIKLTESDYLLDRAILFSGEAIQYFYAVPEFSFLSAWRSIELIAKHEFIQEELNKGIKYGALKRKWENKRGYDKENYIAKVFHNNSVAFNKYNLKQYSYLRNYIGHGSINVIGRANYMKSKDESEYAKITSETYRVIKLSRMLLRKYLI